MRYSELKRSEKQTIDAALDMEKGYVLDFSNRTIEEHFEDEFNIEFYSPKYAKDGDSKAKRTRAILDALDGPQAAFVLRNLWDVRSTLPMYIETPDPCQEDQLSERYFSVVARLEGDELAVDLEAFSSFDDSDTLHALIQAIERDIRADAPEAAMDRLHLFCVKRFRQLLSTRQIETQRDEPLHSLVGKYRKALDSEGKLSEMSILSSAIQSRCLRSSMTYEINVRLHTTTLCWTPKKQDLFLTQ